VYNGTFKVGKIVGENFNISYGMLWWFSLHTFSHIRLIRYIH